MIYESYVLIGSSTINTGGGVGPRHTPHVRGYVHTSPHTMCDGGIATYRGEIMCRTTLSRGRPLGIPPGDTIVGADLPGYITGVHYKAPNICWCRRRYAHLVNQHTHPYR